MKRKFLSKVAFFAMATAALAFTNCSDDTDLGPVEDRLDALEQISIPSIESQLETFELTVDEIEKLLAGFSTETVKNYIDAAVLELQGQVDTNEGDITDLQSQITSNDSDIASLKSQIESNDDDIATLLAKITANEGDISTLETSVTALENENTTLSGQITALETANTTINAAITALQSADTAFDSRIAILEAAKTSLEASITSLQSQISSNDTDIATNAGDIAALKIQVSTLETQVSALQTQVTALEALYERVTALETAKASLEASVLALQTKDTELANLITALQGADVTLQTNIDNTQTYAEGVAADLGTLESAYNLFVENLSSTNITDWDTAFGTSFTSNLNSSKDTLVQWIGDELSTYWSVYFDTTSMSADELAAYDAAMQLVIDQAVADAYDYTDTEIAAAMLALETAYKSYTDTAIENLVEDLNAVVQSITLVPSTFSEVQDNTVLFESDKPEEILYFSFTDNSAYYFAGTEAAANYSATVTYRVAPAATAGEITEENLFICTSTITRSEEDLAKITKVEGDATTGLIKVTFNSTTTITSDASFAFAVGVNSTTDGVTTEITSDYAAAGIDYTDATNITKDIVVGKMVEDELVTVNNDYPAQGELPYNDVSVYDFLDGYDLYYDSKSFADYGIVVDKSFANVPEFAQAAGLNESEDNYDLANTDFFSIVTPETALIGNVITSDNALFAVNGQTIALDDTYCEEVTITYAQVVIDVTPEADDYYTATWNYQTSLAGDGVGYYELGSKSLSDEVVAEISFDTFKSLRLESIVVEKNGTEVDNLGTVTMYLGYAGEGTKYSVYLKVTDDLGSNDGGTYTVEAKFKSNIDNNVYVFQADLFVDPAPTGGLDSTEEIIYAGLDISRTTSSEYLWYDSWATDNHFASEDEYQDAVAAALKAMNDNGDFEAPFSYTEGEIGYDFNLSVQSVDDFDTYEQEAALDLAGCKITLKTTFEIVNPYSLDNLERVSYYVNADFEATTGYYIEDDKYYVIAKDLSQTFKLVDLDDIYCANDCVIAYDKSEDIADGDWSEIDPIDYNLSWKGTTCLSVNLVAKMMVPCAVEKEGDSPTDYFVAASREFTLTTGDPVADEFTNIETIEMYDYSDKPTANVNEYLELLATTDSQYNKTANIFEFTDDNKGLNANLALALGLNTNNSDAECIEPTSVTYELEDLDPDLISTDPTKNDRLEIDKYGVVTYYKDSDLKENIECSVKVTYAYRYGSRSVNVPLVVKPIN